MSASRRRNVKNRFFDWQTEFLPVAGAIPAQIEGFVLSANAAQPTIRQQNCTQINERDATVSGSQEESDAAGKASEMAHQMAMMGKVLKTDIELVLCSLPRVRLLGTRPACPRLRRTPSLQSRELIRYN